MINGLARCGADRAEQVRCRSKRHDKLRAKIEAQTIATLAPNVVDPLRPPAEFKREAGEEPAPPESELRSSVQSAGVRLNEILVEIPLAFEKNIAPVFEHAKARLAVAAAPNVRGIEV